MPAKILLAGEGGQGIQATAKIITSAASKTTKKVSFLPSFGVEQRGGVSLAFIQIGSGQINYPRFSKANIVVCFSNRSVASAKDFINEDSLFIYDSSVINEKNIYKVKQIVKNYVGVPAEKLALEKYSIKTINMILLGALSTQFKDITYDEFEKAIVKEFEKKILKNPEIKDLNINAFKEGIDIAQKFDMSKNKFIGVPEKDPTRNYEKEGIKWHRFPEYCKGCGLCIARCPVQALKFSKDTNFLGTQMPVVDIEKCIGCEKCMHICPDGAIRVEKK